MDTELSNDEDDDIDQYKLFINKIENIPANVIFIQADCQQIQAEMLYLCNK